MVDYLLAVIEEILAVNVFDMEAVKGKILDVMLDCFYLDVSCIEVMVIGICEVVVLLDLIGEVLEIS